MLLVILLYLICATMFTLSKSVLAITQPLFYVGVRMVGAGCLLGIYLLVRFFFVRARPKFTAYDLFCFVQIIVLHIYLTYVCDICALKDLTSTESAFIYNLSPFVSALFSYFFFQEVMTPKKWIGLLLGFASFLPEFIYHSFSGSLMHASLPKLITFIAVVSSAYGWIIVRTLVKERGYSSIFVNCVGMVGGGLLAFITSYFFEPWVPTPVTDWPLFIKLTLAIIVAANLIFYNLYGYLLKLYTATFLSFAGFLCPAFTALFGLLFLHEKLHITSFFSYVLVCIGLFIFYHEELRQGYIAK